MSDPVTAPPWLLDEHALRLEPLSHLSNAAAHLWISRDDLLHPWANGNKLRKLDALLPALLARGITDVLTLGGVQSAHCAALAALCAERGLRAHLLLRGERPAQITGNLLISMMFAHEVRFVSRDDYADREAVLKAHAARLAAESSALHVIPEGGAEPLALRGLARMVAQLERALPQPERCWQLVIDAGTGTSAIGLAAEIARRDLPWQLHAVMLMPDALEDYQQRIAALLPQDEERQELPIIWHERAPKRRFGKIIDEELRTCRTLAQRLGILFDPIYTLAAYEQACRLPCTEALPTVMLHTGGALNLFGAVSRRPNAL